jgi:hypothetical protein
MGFGGSLGKPIPISAFPLKAILCTDLRNFFSQAGSYIEIIVVPAQAGIHRQMDKTSYVPVVAGSVRTPQGMTVLWIPAPDYPIRGQALRGNDG